ncbi:hypothetical protein GCM10027589_47800 [Actinocorallia lasiicapitis]
MLKRAHPIAGFLAFATILTFWVATAAAELSGSEPAVTQVKQTIPWGFLVLIPALVLTGASGFRLSAGSTARLVVAKRRRMPFIAANGVLVLVPTALALAGLAADGDFGTLFWALQAVELAAGAVNLTLLALNLRDGLRLTRRRTNRARSERSDAPGERLPRGQSEP